MLKWLESEEQSFGRTLEQGTKLLDDVIARAQRRRGGGDRGAGRVPAARHVRVPDRPDARDRRRARPGRRRGGVRGADGGAARRASRASAGGDGSAPRRCVSAPWRSPARPGSRPTSSATRRPIARRRSAPSSADNGRVLVKLVESPFYATGGGQVADSGYVECADGDCRAVVQDVLRLGDDQVVAVTPERGDAQARRARARPRRPARAPRDRVQSHGHAPAARGAATAARDRTFTRRGRTSAPTSCASTSRTRAR